MANKSRLQLWQDRLLKNENACQSALDAMDARQKIYLGSSRLISRVKGDRKTKAAHVRNLTAELIEAQVNSSIPQPKVTAKRKEDEGKARLIEDMLRNELDRLPFEQLNDMMERTVPIQGGACFLVEWDNRKRTHTTVGELAVTAVHPKQLIPQEGVTTGIQDMDYVILKLPQTKESLRKRYGVTLEELEQEEEDGKGTDTVTQYTAYYKNDSGGIGLYSWVNDTELEDLPDYQARRIKRCKDCGAPKPEGGEKQPCPKCGCKEWEDSEEEFEELWDPIARSDGSTIPGVFAQEQEDGLGGVVTTAGPTRIPYYKPDIFPVILQKNVSVYGQLLGDSDVDKIADQQNTANRIETKIIEKLIKSGSYLVLPDDASLRADAEDMKVIRPGTPAAAQMISVKDMEGNISQDMAYLAQVYEEARQVIGITDSFQGRRDTTATSGRAKEFSANQAAGRLESKRVMKDAAYAQLFEAMFKFKLAYADEKRPVISRDMDGNPLYEEFNRYDFLEQDAAGEWYWNDGFLFSCDTTAPLANNREAMWQETRQNLQSGAFGNPAELNTLLLFWGKMELLHYPGAGETRRYLERRQAEEAQQAQAQQAQQAQMAQMAEMAQTAEMPPQAQGQPELPPEAAGNGMPVM